MLISNTVKCCKITSLLHLKLNKFYEWNFQSADSKTYKNNATWILKD